MSTDFNDDFFDRTLMRIKKTLIYNYVIDISYVRLNFDPGNIKQNLLSQLQQAF